MSLSEHKRAHIWAVGANTDSPITPPLRVRVQTMARQLLSDAVVPSLADDRFDGSFASDPSFRAALAIAGDTCIGILAGSVDRGRLQLSGLLLPDDEPLSPSGSPTDFSNPSLFGNLTPAKDLEDPITELFQNLLNALDIEASDQRATNNESPDRGSSDPPIEVIELWAHPETGWHRAVAESNGFAPLRGLHQLRCELPLPVETRPTANLVTRSFDPDRDVDALIAVNNRAFADHPDQGGMTRDDLLVAMGQPWFNADGVRLYDDPEHSEVLAGFCWTKIHRGRAGQPDLGEIYAIGVDPRYHGQGLGRPMTNAGLDWLVQQGLTVGMLYVEATNEPALRTYHRLGFTHHRTDRAWSRSVVRGANPGSTLGEAND